MIKEAVEAYEKETGVEIDLEFKGRKGIKEGLIPALDADQQVDLFDGQGNKSNYGDRTVSLEDLVKQFDYEKDTNPVMMELARSYTDGVLKDSFISLRRTLISTIRSCSAMLASIKLPSNWTEFLDTCQKLKDSGVIPLTTDDAYAPQAFGMHLARLMGSDGVNEVMFNENGGWERPGASGCQGL